MNNKRSHVGARPGEVFLILFLIFFLNLFEMFVFIEHITIRSVFCRLVRPIIFFLRIWSMAFVKVILGYLDKILKKV